MRPGGRQIGAEEENAVIAALRQRTLYRYDARPSAVAALEQAFARRTGTNYALAVNSGTSALVCALVGLGIGPGDEVIVPAYTWIAVPNAVLMAGAVPIVAEIDETLTLDPADVARKRSDATRAVIAVHMRGAPCHMDELRELASGGIRLVEDVAQAPGARFRNRALGSLGDAAAFSFQGYKLLTAGEGGMVLTADRDVFVRAAGYHDYDSPLYFGVAQGEWDRQAFAGHSLRMHELEAALALAQLERLDATIAAMRERHARLRSALTDVIGAHGCRLRATADEAGDLGLALVLYLPTSDLARLVAAALRAEGVDGATVLYEAGVVDYHVYSYWSGLLEKRRISGRSGPWDWTSRYPEYHAQMCPRTNELLGRAVHLDVSPELTADQVDEIVLAVTKVLEALV